MFRRVLGVSVFALLLAAPFAGGTPKGPALPEFVDNQVIVVFKGGVTPAQRSAATTAVGAAEVESLGDDAHLLNVPAGTVLEKIGKLNQRPEVLYAEPNFVYRAVDTIPNDPKWPLYGMQKISAPAAWDTTTGSSSVVVGVIDTGVDYTHSDLSANIWSNPGGVGSPSCSAGTHGYDAYQGDCNPMDGNGHGTHVSGTIGAVGNNGTGVVGVNWDVSIMGLRFLDSNGTGTTADAVKAINWAIAAKTTGGINIRVLSNSWGGGGSSSTLQTAINNATSAGMLFVAAAGNASSNNDFTAFYPCNYSNVLCVAATDSSDNLASFSNYGASTVDLGAPGVNIQSTWLGGGYNTISGTSMATPHVSGAAALVLSQQPSLTVSQLRSTLLAAVDPLSSLSGKTVTGGRLNVCKAIIGCGGPATPDFTITALPTLLKIKQGRTKSYTVTVSSVGGFTGTVALSLSGTPANTTTTFTPSAVTGGSGTSTLTVSPASNAPLGLYTLTITGTSGSLVHSTTVQLKIKPPL